jgi:hypothetical protein
MIIYKALYGLRSSGACWHDRFSECLCAEGFFPCMAEPDKDPSTTSVLNGKMGRLPMSP